MIVSLAELYPTYREDIETSSFDDWKMRHEIDEDLDFENLPDTDKETLLDLYYSEISLLH